MRMGTIKSEISCSVEKQDVCRRCTAIFYQSGIIPKEAMDCFKLYVEFYDAKTMFKEYDNIKKHFHNTKCFITNGRIEVVIYNEDEGKREEDIKKLLDILPYRSYKGIRLARGCENIREAFPEVNMWEDIFERFFREKYEKLYQQYVKEPLIIENREGKVEYKPSNSLKWEVKEGKEAEELIKHSKEVDTTTGGEL